MTYLTYTVLIVDSGMSTFGQGDERKLQIASYMAHMRPENNPQILVCTPLRMVSHNCTFLLD